MNHEEYLDIRGLMAQRGTRAGENKRIPMKLVTAARAEQLEAVEIRLHHIQVAAPFVLCALGLLIGLMV
jgi:hypothetical protein